MIFVGDISLPFANAIRVVSLPNELQNKNWFGNLEGALVKGSSQLVKRLIVFNDEVAIRKLVEEFCFKGFALANNHIFDCGSFEYTSNTLDEIRVPYCGAGRNLGDARKPLVIKDGGKEIAIINFGWEVIQCKSAKATRAGVNPLTPLNILNVLKETRSQYPYIPIVVFLHWNYELEAFPHPRERELARCLIDHGAAGIIGCHSHRIGGFEVYKGRPIVYSLGNWLFKQGFFYNGRISFPPFCRKEVAFEWDLLRGIFKFHFFEYNPENDEVRYVKTEGPDSPTMKSYTPFLRMTNQEYSNWYKEQRYHRNKGLPIYYSWNSPFNIKAKDWYNKIRDIVIRTAFKIIR